MNGWGRGRKCRRGRGWGRGRGMGRGFGRGAGWGRKGWGMRFGMGRGFGLSQIISKPISAIKGLLARESPEVVQKAQEIYTLLPKRDCGACGYDNCYQCALAIAKGEAPPDACRIVGKKIKDKVEEILRR